MILRALVLPSHFPIEIPVAKFTRRSACRARAG